MRANQTESEMPYGLVDALRQSSNTVRLPDVRHSSPQPCPAPLPCRRPTAEQSDAARALLSSMDLGEGAPFPCMFVG